MFYVMWSNCEVWYWYIKLLDKNTTQNLVLIFTSFNDKIVCLAVFAVKENIAINTCIITLKLVALNVY